MNEQGPTWVVGRGGLLGRSIIHRLVSTHTFDNEPIDWPASRAIDDIEAATRAFLGSTRDGQWTVIWCAGAGIIGTARAELDHETAILARLLDTLEGPGTVVLSSSAGGIYGGCHDIPITEDSAPAPLSDYGRNKLIQEDRVRQWAESSGGRAIIARIANLYGPGQQLSKPQGLISQICLATLTRRPVSVYVSLDTLRDYLFVDDCSRMIVGCIETSRAAEPGTCTTKILASESSISIGGLLNEARRVLSRPPTVVMASSAKAALQSSAMTFHSTVWPDVGAFARTPLPVGIHRTAEYIRHELHLGILA